MSEYRNPQACAVDSHVITNQVPPLEPYNLFTSDPPLQAALNQAGGIWAEDALTDYGRRLGDDLGRAGRLAEQYPPVLHSHDPSGFRIDMVEYHDAYHQLMRAGIDAGLPSIPWTENTRSGRYAVRVAFIYMHHQVDAGTCCPMTMTFAAVPALRHQPEIAEQWEPLLTTRQYDGRNRPWYEKAGATVGMAMTEKQGGTDVGANTTRAEPVKHPGPGREYRLTGHKWFCSAPMSDAFLVLAQAQKGLSCFLMPRWQPDGHKNPILIQRLKDKLGNRSNASSEIELNNSFAWLIGEEGRGVANIMEMVALTRFDCVAGSAALMRQALVQAVHHCRYRQVMGRRLIEQPLMRNVLADLALESEVALLLAMELARQLEAAENGDANARHFARLATAVGKYWVCRRTPAMVNEAAECLGGAGFVEESRMPWLYREAPLNATWEGCSNVQCLDVLRALSRDPESLAVLRDELDTARGADKRLDQWLDNLQLPPEGQIEFQARHWVGRLALALQAVLLFRSGEEPLAKAFCSSRLQGLNHTYGTLTDPDVCEYLLRRAFPT